MKVVTSVCFRDIHNDRVEEHESYNKIKQQWNNVSIIHDAIAISTRRTALCHRLWGSRPETIAD